jgi:[acyl-carrier-protein] S-malonyltransferase
MSRAAVFPGQGAQKPGMGLDLMAAYPEARALFERADAAIDFPLTKTITTASADTVHRTDICQPGIFLVSAATIEVLKTRTGLDPESFSAAAGLSLGEYTALWFAGAFSFEDGVRLTRLRGELMQQASDAEPSGMTSLMGLDLEAVERACATVREDGGVVCVANLNSPGQVVISGGLDAVARAAKLAKEAGARRAIPLAVAGAFHSPLMAPAAEGLAERLQTIDIAKTKIPVIANVLAAPVSEPAEIRENLVAQLTSPVLWERSMRYLLAEGVSEFLEPGPGTVLAGLMKKIDRSTTVTGYPDAAAIG